MINLFATDVGKKSLNDESPEMNAAISRKKPGFVMMKQKVNKNHVNLQCGFTKGIGAFPSSNLLHSSLTCQLAFSTHTNFLIFDRILINCPISTYFFHLKINGYCKLEVPPS